MVKLGDIIKEPKKTTEKPEKKAAPKKKAVKSSGVNK